MKPADPVFLGLLLREGWDLAHKVIEKRIPEQNLGIFVRKGDKFAVWGNIKRVSAYG